MKKKELLIIFILAVLVAGLAPLIPWYIECSLFMLMPWPPCGPVKGWPLPFLARQCVRNCISTTPYNPQAVSKWIFSEGWMLSFFLDLLFWFLVLAGSWWVVKWVLKRIKKKK